MANPMNFTNKLVVITGVGRAGQVGEALALNFAKLGATLALLDLQKAEVDARAQSLRDAGYSVTAHVANLADADAAKGAADEVVAATRDRFRGVHAVICAGRLRQYRSDRRERPRGVAQAVHDQSRHGVRRNARVSARRA